MDIIDIVDIVDIIDMSRSRYQDQDEQLTQAEHELEDYRNPTLDTGHNVSSPDNWKVGGMLDCCYRHVHAAPSSKV